MTKFKSSGYIESINNAIKGLKLAISSQRNFKLEVIIAVIVFISAQLLKFTVIDMAILSIMIAFVLITELLNSIIEFTLDAVYKNNYSKVVEMAKDMSAGMVFLTAFVSIIVGIYLFVPHFVEWLY